MSGIRSRRNANGNHDALLDGSLSESQKNAALKNGTYTGSSDDVRGFEQAKVCLRTRRHEEESRISRIHARLPSSSDVGLPSCSQNQLTA